MHFGHRRFFNFNDKLYSILIITLDLVGTKLTSDFKMHIIINWNRVAIEIKEKEKEVSPNRPVQSGRLHSMIGLKLYAWWENFVSFQLLVFYRFIQL